MKRLYHCTAYYDNNNLQSYDTMIITKSWDSKGREIITYYNYRSATTIQHIRKYIRQLWDNLAFDMSRKVSQLYQYAMRHKNQAYIYMIDGEIK